MSGTYSEEEASDDRRAQDRKARRRDGPIADPTHLWAVIG